MEGGKMKYTEEQSKYSESVQKGESGEKVCRGTD
jgi:hypothetical protein